MNSFKNATVTAALLSVFLPISAHAVVAISSDPTQNMNCANGICAPTEANAVLNAADLMNMLATGNVRIGVLFKYKHRTKSAGYIAVNVPLNLGNTNTLTFDSSAVISASITSMGASGLTVSQGVQINAPISVLGTGTLTFDSTAQVNASITIMGTGALATSFYFSLAPNVSVTFWDLNSKFTVEGTQVTLVGDVPTLAADITAAKGKGLYALANDYDAKNDSFRKAPIQDFKGSLTGLGHSISNLTIKKGHSDCEGLVSENEGSISDIRLHAVTVISASQKNVGAIAGCNYGSILNVSVDGTVTAGSNSNVGGIAGINSGSDGGSIALSNASAAVTGGQAGGIVGQNDSRSGLYKVYFGGSVTGQTNVGGLVGANRANLQESYSTAAVNGNGGTVGGLAGFNGTQIVDSYSTGAVSGAATVGGFIGYDPDESVSNGYWDLETSGISDPNQGAGVPKYDTSIIGLTTAQLRSRLPAGFDKQIWALDPNVNNGFPYLREMPPQ